MGNDQLQAAEGESDGPGGRPAGLPGGPQSGRPPERGGKQPVWSSETLFGEALEVLIEHEGVVYRLRKTRLGRLILQK